MWRVSFRSGVATLRTDVHLLLTYLQQQIIAVLTARRYASAVYAMALCPSVRPSVRLSHVGVPDKLGNTQTKPHDSPRILVF